MVRISDPDKRRRGRQGELERKDARVRGDLLVQFTSYLGLPVILKFKGWVVGGSALDVGCEGRKQAIRYDLEKVNLFKKCVVLPGSFKIMIMQMQNHQRLKFLGTFWDLALDSSFWFNSF